MNIKTTMDNLLNHNHLSDSHPVDNNGQNQRTLEAKSEMPMPISTGERPLFVSRYLLQTMSRNISQGYHPYMGFSDFASYAYQVDIFLLAEIYRERKNTIAKPSLHDLSDIFQNLPLFFSHEMVKKWEMKRVWAQSQYGLPEAVISYYSQLLDSATPSDAYQSHDLKEKLVWSRWFENSEMGDVLQVLDESRLKLAQWEKTRHQYESIRSLYYNVAYLGKNLGLSQTQYMAWIFLELVLHAHEYQCDGQNAGYTEISNRVWTTSLRAMPIRKFLDLLNQALNLPANSIASLFYTDSPLVKKGFFPAIEALEDKKIHSKDTLIEMIHGVPRLQQILFSPANTSTDILLNIAQPYIANHESTLALSAWPDAQLDIQKAFLSLHHNKFPKVLIYGLPGSGKSNLVQSLLSTEHLPGQHHNKRGWIPDFEDSRHSYGDNKKNMDRALEINLFLLKIHPDNVLVFDGNTAFMESEDNRKIIRHTIEQKELAQIWVVDNLDKVQPDIFSQFDVVIYLGEMNQKKRLEMAKQYFKDDDLSYRISQSTRTPGDIRRLDNWCCLSQDYSWKNIFHFLSSRDKLSHSIKGAKILLKEILVEEELVEMAGYPQMDELLKDLSDYFTHPEYYRKLDAKVPKGILLTGEPGTGKTHFAKHLTRNIGVPLYMVDTSKLANDINLIASVFEQARQKSPCILFMDEIDSLINNPAEFGLLNLDKQTVLNAFLSQLDGIHSSEGVLVIGATHRHFTPDPAAVRAGRLGQQINLSLPNEEARKSIWQVHLKNKPLSASIDYDDLAKMSSSFSAAEIAEAINRGCLQAAKVRSNHLEQTHLSLACDDIFWGNPDNHMVLNEEEKEHTAIHEAGHALIAMKNGFKVQRITVRPRAKALGAVQWQLEEGEYTFSREKLIARIELALGGIASEKSIFGSFKNGGTSDLRHTKDLLFHMLMEAGLGNTFGLFSSEPKESPMWSEQRKMRLEQEAHDILEQAMNNCCQWLTSNRDIVIALAHSLKTEREISGKQLLQWKEKVKSINPVELTSHYLPDLNDSGRPEHTTIHTDKN